MFGGLKQYEYGKRLSAGFAAIATAHTCATPGTRSFIPLRCEVSATFKPCTILE